MAAGDLDAGAFGRLLTLAAAGAAGSEGQLGGSAASSPGDVLLEEGLGLARDPDPLPAGVLAEAGDAPLGGGRPGGVACPGGQLDLGQGTDNDDLVTFQGDLGRSREPAVREPAGKPTTDRRGVCVFHNYKITRFRQAANMWREAYLRHRAWTGNRRTHHSPGPRAHDCGPRRPEAVRLVRRFRPHRLPGRDGEAQHPPPGTVRPPRRAG